MIGLLQTYTNTMTKEFVAQFKDVARGWELVRAGTNQDGVGEETWRCFVENVDMFTQIASHHRQIIEFDLQTQDGA